MDSLKLVTDDIGVQNLITSNRLPVTAGSVDAVSPYPSTHSARIGEGHAERVPITDRRKRERRGGDRRKQQVAVLLDTRSPHNRRGFENRRDNAANDGVDRRPRTGINLYA